MRAVGVVHTAQPLYLHGPIRRPCLSLQARIMDGVVVNFNTLPGGAMPSYNKGLTTVHEVRPWPAWRYT